MGLALVTPAGADQVVTNEGNFPAAQIVCLEQGRLRFRSADGKLHNAWLHDIKLLLVDRGGIFDDLNQAERFLADGQAQRAVSRYRRSLRFSEDFWTDLITARLLLACDAAGQLNTATQYFIRVVNGRFSGPPAAARLIPQKIPAGIDKRVERALEHLNAAMARGPDEERGWLIELLRYEIARRIGDVRASQAARIAALSIPPEARSLQVFQIKLHAIRSVLDGEVKQTDLGYLDRAIRETPHDALPGFLLLKGETLLRTATTRDEMIRASWPFVRVAVHFRDDPLAAEGLYGTALALERLGRTDKALALLEECLGHERLTQRIRDLAGAAKTRLRPAHAP